jgi:hypothetical protein
MALTKLVESPRPAPGFGPNQRAFATVAEVNRLIDEIQDGGEEYTDLTITNNLTVGGDVITDNVIEYTADAGVTVDGMLIKDNAVVNAASLSSSGGITGAIFYDGIQNLSGPGAVSVTKGRTAITTTGADAFTLAAGTDGAKKSIYLAVRVGNATITPTGLLGFTTITLTAVGQGVTLVYDSNLAKWVIVGNHGATIA